ncbi:DDE_3 domain-containing protein [Trichonephila clavipes]|nr:DDE_3 domain-containing protein [Trichonephila clavipes]
MTGHICRDVILEQHVRLFRGAMGAEFLFMDDNARPQRANIADECLQSEDITPRQPPSTCLPELRKALLDEWCNIPQDQIDNLILSMPRRWTEDSEVVDHHQADAEEICQVIALQLGIQWFWEREGELQLSSEIAEAPLSAPGERSQTLGIEKRGIAVREGFSGARRWDGGVENFSSPHPQR